MLLQYSTDFDDIIYNFQTGKYELAANRCCVWCSLNTVSSTNKRPDSMQSMASIH